MLLPDTGAYADCSDKMYELETNYYLHFHIKSALVSIDFLLNPIINVLGCFENKAQYYHYYSEHLLYSVGQISERFRIDNRNTDYNERRKTNRQNYEFTEAKYPILSKKAYRNTIVHIDERDIDLIKTKDAVGGFNYIDNEIPTELRSILLSNRDTHIYTLDLLSQNLLITNDGTQLTMNLNELKHELFQLDNSVVHLSKFTLDF